MEHTCCFFGHREIKISEKLTENLSCVIERLILSGVDTFLFGSKSKFDEACYEAVSRAKKKYPQIKRVYVRAEFPYINEDYKKYLLEFYEGTYYPDKIDCAGKAVYVERNREMIEKSKYCVVYCDENYKQVARKSGTKLALKYATMKRKCIINVFEMI